MIIKIKNCNNIDVADISIDENMLNIKYAMNGTGKSTIAKAIELHIKGGDAINELMPFKHIESKTLTEKPSVEGLEAGTTVAIFNDSYINQYAFKPDEILLNSFQIFVKTPDYDTRMEKIDKLITDIKDTFRDSEPINQIISDLGILSESFGKSKSGYSEAGALAKGIGKGNKIANVPKGLESYSEYLKSSVNAKWLRWQMDGNNNFSDISDNCPYCTSPTADKKKVISQISKEYDPKSIEHLNKIIGVLESLSKYFSVDANSKLKKLTNNVQGFSKEEISYLLHMKGQIETLKGKMLDLKGLTYFSLRDVLKISELFASLKIDLDYLPELNSDNTKAIVRDINDSLDKVLKNVGVLQGEINQQNQLIKKTIEDNKSEINDFLKNAGYKYLVDVEYINAEYKMRLRHYDYSQAVLNNGSQHLSYGERNALSLILFMYECLAKNPKIVILDDPISSFDRNKKYAVIEMLFRGKKCLRDRTVLMMTHDLEPVIDILYNLRGKLPQVPSAAFIEAKNGIAKEIPITRDDISTFGLICDVNIKNSNEDIVKLVYLRRYYEILNNKGLAYQLLSNLFHKRTPPIKIESGQETLLTQAEIQEATDEIKKKLPSFDYEILLTKLSDNEAMKSAYKKVVNNYEKLQIFRVLDLPLHKNTVLNKFINETFHIENEYIMQINPCKYDIVPGYIIDECDKLILEEASAIKE